MTLSADMRPYNYMYCAPHQDGVLHEEHENMQLNLKTTPIGLPLQGSREISQASLDLSLSRGVWKPRKCKKVKGEEEKITNNREEEASCLID